MSKIQVKAGNVLIGNSADVTIQSMLNTRADDIQGSVLQAKRLEEAGCQIIRAAIPDMDAVGFAPTARGAHTSHEYIFLPETPDYWKWMLELLKEKE